MPLLNLWDRPTHSYCYGAKSGVCPILGGGEGGAMNKPSLTCWIDNRSCCKDDFSSAIEFLSCSNRNDKVSTSCRCWSSLCHCSCFSWWNSFFILSIASLDDTNLTVRWIARHSHGVLTFHQYGLSSWISYEYMDIADEMNGNGISLKASSSDSHWILFINQTFWKGW